jgi:hypothetical protein
MRGQAGTHLIRREQAARRFTPAVMAARYADLYEQLISGFVPRAAAICSWSCRIGCWPGK